MAHPCATWPIVAIGGGSGPSLIARALSSELERFVAIVCTTDRGSSTGVCRELFRMPAPGDIRATLSTLAALSGKQELSELMESRLRLEGLPELDNMALGNLLLGSLFSETGDMAKAVARMERILEVRGKVLPATNENGDLEAELDDGSIVVREPEVRRVGKPFIRQIRWHGGSPPPAPGVIETLREAALILIGPGCLYTSIMPCLLVREVSRAIRERKGKSLFICNTTTTPGQTDDLSAAGHVREIIKVLGREGLDGVLFNRATVDQVAVEQYSAIGVRPLVVTEEDLDEVAAMGIETWAVNLIEAPLRKPRTLHKIDTIRHDPGKLRLALKEICREIGIPINLGP